MSLGLAAGDLVHRVRLQREALSQDSTFGDSTGFLDVATLWANVTTTGGREFYEAKRLTPELTHQVEIRYRTDVGPGMRFLYGAAVLRILAAPDPDGRRIRRLCMCQELVQ